MQSRFLEKLIGNYKRFRNRKSVYGIHDEDLRSVLDDVGSLNEIIAGNVNCKVCGEVLNLDNLGGWVSIHGQPQYICDKDNCLFTVEAGDRQGVEND